MRVTTERGTPQTQQNVRRRTLAYVVKAANPVLAKQDRPPDQPAADPPLALWHTSASLLSETGASVPYVMGQLGNLSSGSRLDHIYAHVLQRAESREEGGQPSRRDTRTANGVAKSGPVADENPDPEQAKAATDTEGVLGMLIDYAHHRLDGQAGIADALTLKLLGFLAVDAAAITLLATIAITSTQRHAGWWWVVVAGFTVSGFLCIWAARLEDFEVGPDMEDIYEKTRALSLLNARLEMLAKLKEAIDKNSELVPKKATVVQWAIRVVLGSVVASMALALIIR